VPLPTQPDGWQLPNENGREVGVEVEPPTKQLVRHELAEEAGAKMDNVVPASGYADLDLLIKQHIVKELNCTAKVAELVGMAEFTVREKCRLGRVCARKRRCAHGKLQKWMIAFGNERRAYASAT
jgi:hypothetical protein